MEELSTFSVNEKGEIESTIPKFPNLESLDVMLEEIIKKEK